ncbi:TPA: hypothetical protein ACXEWJ_004418, partial [Klebsiella variicola]
VILIKKATINLLSRVNSADRYACSDHYFLSDSLKITGEYDEENHTQRSHFLFALPPPLFLLVENFFHHD